MSVDTLPASRLTRIGLHSAVMLCLLFGASRISGVTAMAAPFCASCVLLVLLPQSPFSTPRTVMLAHLICLGAGATMLALPMPALALALAAAWLSLLAMAWLRVVHAPAVAHAVILALGQQQAPRYLTTAIAVAALLALSAQLAVRRRPAPDTIDTISTA